MQTKGIILAGGKGTRLYPMTSIVNKQLQPIYDKPMIYYPLSTLMLGGIKEILIITTPEDLKLYQILLKDGKQWGIEIEYAIQKEPKGLPEAFIIGEQFIGKNQVCLILGDNLFYGKLDFFRIALNTNRGATIFGYEVENPESYGVVEFDENNKVISIEEKPAKPKSNYAIPGLYIFDSQVVEISKDLKPSKRGEIEITDVHKAYLNQGRLNVQIIGRGIAWLDTGTPDALLEASNFIRAIEKRQGRKIACLEEIALKLGFINSEQYKKYVDSLPNCDYKKYCRKIFTEFTNKI